MSVVNEMFLAYLLITSKWWCEVQLVNVIKQFEILL